MLSMQSIWAYGKGVPREGAPNELSWSTHIGSNPSRKDCWKEVDQLIVDPGATITVVKNDTSNQVHSLGTGSSGTLQCNTTRDNPDSLVTVDMRDGRLNRR